MPELSTHVGDRCPGLEQKRRVCVPQVVVDCELLHPAEWVMASAPAKDATPRALTRFSPGDYFTATRTVIGS